MAILVDQNTRAVVQGITGREGSGVTRYMLEYGTNILAGVTPGKKGTEVWGLPVYDTVKEASDAHGPFDASVVYVPAPQAKAAIVEALDAGIKLIVAPIERFPERDAIYSIAYAKKKRAQIIGPGSMGCISPGRAALGMAGGSVDMAGVVFKPGCIGVMSRSGGQTSTVGYSCSQAGLGVSTAINIGAEPIVGSNFVNLLPLFEKDPETRAVAMFGEIGTVAEEEASELIRAGGFTKPAVAYVAGATLPTGMRYSHASAIVEGGKGTAASKIKALTKAGVTVVDRPDQIAPTLKKLLNFEGGSS